MKNGKNGKKNVENRINAKKQFMNMMIHNMERFDEYDPDLLNKLSADWDRVYEELMEKKYGNNESNQKNNSERN